MYSGVMRHIDYRTFDGATLNALNAPELVTGLGWVVWLCLHSQRDSREVAAHLVLPEDEEAAEALLADAVRRLQEPGAAVAALDRPLAETLGLAEAVFEEWMFEPTKADEQRRSAALRTMLTRFPAVQERFQRVYGLRLPRHMAVFAAFWNSLDEREQDGMEHLGLHAEGISVYFERDGLQLVASDGLDERLHYRFRRDPAEFVTVLGGDTDGLHFGLWHDDPAELPSFIVHNYARDSAETWTSRNPTVLAEIRERLEESVEDDDSDDTRWALHPLRRALDWFADADARALAEDGERRWADTPRAKGGISIGPALPPGSGDPRAGEIRARLDAYRNDPATARRWIDEAMAELAAGRPALALVIGAELHWLDRDEYRRKALDLLVGAYRNLGRDALAAIAEVHFAHRDLPTVDGLTAV